MEISIEDASKFLGKYYDIEKQCFRREAFSKQQLAYLLTDYNAIGLSARVNSEIAGFTIRRIDIVRSIPFGHILTVGVVPSYRRKGIAEKLLNKIEVLFKEKGADECLLEVQEDNAAALSLYQTRIQKRGQN
jgi:ribosomal protein S18 acetylase RimI-like enzyme